MTPEVVRVGIVGLGRVSESHISGYQALGNARISAVCDTDERSAEEIGTRLGVRFYNDYEQLLADPAVDAVTLLLPHELHYPVAMDALNAGKHVCLEKPMAVTEAQCADISALAKRRGLKLTVANNTRYASAHCAAKRVIDEGRLGSIQLVRVCMIGNEVGGFLSSDPRDAWRRERNGIGALMDNAVHYFYLLRWLLGDVARIQAIGRNVLPDMGVEDYVLVSAELESGGWFTIEIDLTAEITWQERMEIYGSTASLVIDHKHDPPALLYQGWNAPEGVRLTDVPYDPAGWRDASIAATAEDFIGVIAEGRTSAVDLGDSEYAVRLVEKANESMAAGGTAITV